MKNVNKCIVCGEDTRGGKYKNLDVCFECYETGELLKYFSEHNIIDDDSSILITGEEICQD